MSDTIVGTDLGSALRAAHAAVDELLTAPLEPATEDELLDSWRELERLARRLPAVEHRFVNEARTRSLPATFACRGMTQFLRQLLRLHPHEAKARATAAEAAGPRTALTGEPLPPIYPEIAAAQQSGEISPRHADLVVKTIQGLPDVVQVEHPELEAELVGHARRFDPAQCAKLAHRVMDWLNPDGILDDVAHRERSRGFDLRRRADGSGRFEGEATAELAERLQVLFDSLAGPKQETNGVKDPRTATQRRHDALLDGLTRLQTSDTLPSAGGVSATIVLTMTPEQYLNPTGLVRTGHGALVPAEQALDWAGLNHRVIGVVIDRMKGITHYSDIQRCFTEQQRLAMIARDGGCSFPGCDTAPGWCEAHHIVPWQDSRRTSVDNGTLVCGYHHREHERLGWRAELINGQVGWIPPKWLDKDQQLRFNTAHSPAGLGSPGRPPDCPQGIFRIARRQA
jgi:NAD-specific glutamate dehydrogenase